MTLLTNSHFKSTPARVDDRNCDIAIASREEIEVNRNSIERSDLGRVRLPKNFLAWLIVLISILCASCQLAQAQTLTLDKLQGLCTRGGQVIHTGGAASSEKAEMVVPSCTVTVYTAGTLTPAIIYSDRSGSPTAKPNPFTASASGEWFFYASAGRYDIRLSGGTGPGAYPSPVTYGDQWISNPSSAPTQNTTHVVEAYNAVRDGGCDNTGATNATICLNAALAAANTAHRQFFLPAGTYTANLLVNGINSQRIFGEGEGATIIQSALAASPVIYLNNTLGITHSITIDHLSVVGNGTGVNNHGIYQFPNQPFGITIEHVRINNTGGNGIFLESNAFTIRLADVDVSIPAAGGNGIDIQGDNTVMYERCYVHSVGTGKAAYRPHSGSHVFVACNGIDPGSINADWMVAGDLLSDGDSQNLFARVKLIASNVEAFTGVGGPYRRGIRVKSGSQLSLEHTKFTSSTAGAHVAILFDSASGSTPLIFDAASNFQLDGGSASWYHGAAIHSTGQPFLFQGAVSPSSYWDNGISALVDIGYQSVADNLASFRSTPYFNRAAFGPAIPTAGLGYDNNLYFASHDTYSIGSATVGRPLNLYLGNSLQLANSGTIVGQNFTITGSASSPSLEFSAGGTTARAQVLTGDKFQIGTTSAHSVGILTNGTINWLFDSSGNFKVNTGSVTIGSVAGNRPTSVYASSTLDVGLSGITTGTQVFRTISNSNTIGIRAGATAASYNFTLPTSLPGSTLCIAVDTSGVWTYSACAGGGGGGTVTSVATTGPISGGTITSTGTISCPTCVTSAAALTNNALMIGQGLQASAVTTTGTGVLTALGINIGSAGAFVTFNGALGTPSSGTATNLTGLPLTTGVTGTLPVANGGTNLTTATDDNLMVGNGTTWQSKALTTCPDTGGNHLNYDASTNTFSCGTSGSGGGVSSVTATNSTLTISPTTGAVLAGINLANANTWTALPTVAIDDSGTTTTTNTLDLQHSSSGTPGVGFGSGIRFGLETTTTLNQQAGLIKAVWGTATHASRQSYVSISGQAVTTTSEVARFQGIASSVNYFDIYPSATGQVLALGANGTDTNIGIDLQPKGSGTVTIVSVPVLTESSTNTVTNKSIAAGSNTITGLVNANLSGSAGITSANLSSTITAGSCTSCNLTYDLAGRITVAANGSGGGGSPPFDDGTAILKGSADATKLLRVEVDGITTGTTRVWTAPNADTSIPVYGQTITYSGPTAARTVTYPDANFTVARTDAGQTFTGTQAFGAVTASGTIVQTSASATAFESGQNGGTNPVLRVVNSTASQASGISITGNATGAAAGTVIAALDSGATSHIAIVPLGSAGRFIVRQPGGTAGTDELQIWNDGTNSTISHPDAAGQLQLFSTNTLRIGISATDYSFASSGGRYTVGLSGLAFSSNSTSGAGTIDVAVVRSGTNGIRLTNLSTGSGSLLIAPSTASVTGNFTVLPDNAATATVVDIARFGVNSTGTAAAGFGGQNSYTLETSTTNDTAAGVDKWYWMSATNGSQGSVFSRSNVSNGITVERDYIAPRKTLTDATATNLVTITLPTLKGASGFIDYEAFAADATDVQVRRGTLAFSVVNKAGTYTTEISVVNEGASPSTGTFTCTFDFSNGTNATTLRANCDTSLTATSLYMVFHLRNQSEQAMTIQ